MSAPAAATPAVAAVNHLAPDFALPCTSTAAGRGQAALSDYRGKWLGLLFYPKDFSFICPTELTALSARVDEFRRRGCELLAVSTDSLSTHESWIAAPRAQGGLGSLNFPLAADEDGKVCRAYGVYVPFQHIALRGLFIIDPNGVLQYSVVHNLSVGRRSEEILRVLAALQTGGLCPENWSEGQATMDVAETIGPNSQLGSYRILQRLGGGSFGTVFKAYDTTLERLVALKVLRSGDAAAMKQTLAEARAAAALQHPHVCAVYGVDSSEGAPMIAMEYVAGQPLSKKLEGGALSEAEAKRLGRQIAQGLAAAHAHGVTHGDLKPANIMVTDDGLAKIMDFGLARREKRGEAVASIAAETMALKDAEQTPSGLSGTPAYMSPEQTRGEKITGASDVFSFGLTLAEMLCGERILQGKSLLELIRQIEAIDPEAVAARVPASFRPLLRQALIPDTGRRTLKMTEIAELLA